jgi:hypothetical protein
MGDHGNSPVAMGWRQSLARRGRQQDPKPADMQENGLLEGKPLNRLVAEACFGHHFNRIALV